MDDPIAFNVAREIVHSGLHQLIIRPGGIGALEDDWLSEGTPEEPRCLIFWMLHDTGLIADVYTSQEFDLRACCRFVLGAHVASGKNEVTEEAPA